MKSLLFKYVLGPPIVLIALIGWVIVCLFVDPPEEDQ